VHKPKPFSGAGDSKTRQTARSLQLTSSFQETTALAAL